jgi:two-component system cell cycle sensor histidine kinase/response regulator CckA
MMAGLFRLGRWLLAVCITCAAASNVRAQATETAGRDLDKPLVVAVSEVFYPYQFRDTDGEIKGFAVDVTEAVMRAVNLRIQWRAMTNTEMGDALRTGRVDVLHFWAETPERRVFADFSVPIARFETVAVVRKNDSRIRRLTDLKGRRVGIGQKGTVGWNYLVNEMPGANPVFTENSEQFLRMLADGEIDAAVMSRLTAASMIERFDLKNLKVLEDRIKGDKYDVRYCFTVRKGDAQLLARLNEGLAIVQRTGEFDTIYRKWFSRYEALTFRPVEVVSYVAAALALACIAVTWGLLRQRTLRRRIARQADELAEQRSLLAALHEKHPLATLILEVPVEGPVFVVSANSEAQRLFALDHTTQLPLPLGQLPLAPERVTYIETAVNRWRDGTHGRPWETQLAATQQLLETALVPLGHDERGRQRICVLSNDVTRRRLMDQEVAQSRRLRALGELVGGIAHEFNNLLTPIILTTSQAHSDLRLRAETRSDFGLIESAARRAAELTQRLLTFGRKADDRAQPVLLADAVENCFALLRPTVDRRIEWSVRSPGILPAVHFNPTDLNQVVFNLVINARDTLTEKLAQERDPEWTPRLTVTIAELPATTRPLPPGAAGRTLAAWQRLTVEDNGLGIPPEIVERVFEPFFTTKDVGRGTGLGLATVWHLVTEAGGEVALDSTPGAGTRFHITLPRWTQTSKSTPPIRVVNKPTAPAGSGNVLLVEDEPLVVETSSALLRRHGYNVTHRPDGAAAWETLEADASPYDVLLVDVNMPRMSGIDLIRHVRAIRFTGAIIVMSGRLTEQERRILAELHVDHLLAKPFTGSELIEGIREVLSRTAAV